MFADLWESQPRDAHRKQLCAQLHDLTPEQVATMAAEVRDFVVRSTDTDVLFAAANAYVRYALTRGDGADLVRIIERMPYPGPAYAALSSAAIRGDADPWPVLAELIARGNVSDSDIGGTLSAWLDSRSLAALPTAFSKLTIASPRIAADASATMSAKPERLRTIIPQVIALASRGQLLALRALYRAATDQLPLGDLSSLAVGLERTDGEAQEALMQCLVRDRVNRHADLDEELCDPRPFVRRALVRVVHAMQGPKTERRDLWPYVCWLGVDPERGVRDEALSTLRRLAEDDASFAPEPEVVRGWLTRGSMEALDDALAMLAFLAARWPSVAARWHSLVGTPARSQSERALARALTTRPTRACTLCAEMARVTSWNHDLSAPKSFKKLVGTGPLRSCPECCAYFTYSYEVEYEVTSAYESHDLVRLTRKELLAQHAAHVDTSAPRFAEWAAALEADLDHAVPSVRAAAAAELARDAITEKAFARLEETLLHHPSPEVVRAALAVLRESCRLERCPVSRDVLAVLATHPDPTLQHHASFLLTVKEEGPWTLRTGAAGEAQLEALGRLLDEKRIAPPTSARELAQTALAAPIGTWSFFHTAAKVMSAAPDRGTCASLVIDAVAGANDVARRNALELARHFPGDLLANRAFVERVAACNSLSVEQRAELVASMVSAGAPLEPAVATFTAALETRRAENVVKAIRAAYDRGQASDELFVPLCRHCELTRNAYAAMSLAAAWAAARDVPRAALPILDLLADEASGSFHDDAVRTLTAIHLRAKDDDALMGLLAHRLYSTRGIAAATIGKAQLPTSAAVLARLTEMTASDHWYPKGEAKTALQHLGARP